MKTLRKFLGVAAFLMFLNPMVNAGPGGDHPGGDGPFPLRCVDFTGKWVHESSTMLYVISQEGCGKIHIAKYAIRAGKVNQKASVITDIIPDGKTRGNMKTTWSKDGTEIYAETYKAQTQQSGVYRVVSLSLVYDGEALKEKITDYNCTMSYCVKAGVRTTKWFKR